MLAMKDAQKPIAAWMQSVLADKKKSGLTASSWASKAGLGRNTVSRALHENYEHVTSTTTLLKLAGAVRAKLPASAMMTDGLPSEASLREALGQILAVAVPDREIAPDVLRGLAGALRDTLGLLAAEQGAAPDPGAIRAMARTTALLQFRPDATE